LLTLGIAPAGGSRSACRFAIAAVDYPTISI
jgi:hypothetical protein